MIMHEERQIGSKLRDRHSVGSDLYNTISAMYYSPFIYAFAAAFALALKRTRGIQVC